MVWSDTSAVDTDGKMIAERYLTQYYAAYRLFSRNDLFDCPSASSRRRSAPSAVGRGGGAPRVSRRHLRTHGHGKSGPVPRPRSFDANGCTPREPSTRMSSAKITSFIASGRAGPVAYADVPTVLYEVGAADSLTQADFMVPMARHFLVMLEPSLSSDGDRIRRRIAEHHRWRPCARASLARRVAPSDGRAPRSAPGAAPQSPASTPASLASPCSTHRPSSRRSCVSASREGTVCSSEGARVRASADDLRGRSALCRSPVGGHRRAAHCRSAARGRSDHLARFGARDEYRARASASRAAKACSPSCERLHGRRVARGVAWPVHRLARVSGVSEAHFARSFKEAYGVPPRYLLTRRIERATALLRDTGFADYGDCVSNGMEQPGNVRAHVS